MLLVGLSLFALAGFFAGLAVGLKIGQISEEQAVATLTRELARVCAQNRAAPDIDIAGVLEGTGVLPPNE